MWTLTVRLPDYMKPKVKGQAGLECIPVNRWIEYAILDRLDRKEAERDSEALQGR